MSEAEVAEWFGKLSARAWDDLLETERQILMSLYNDKYPKVMQDSEGDIDDEECEDCDEDKTDEDERKKNEVDENKKKTTEFDFNAYFPEEEKPDVVIIDPVR